MVSTQNKRCTDRASRSTILLPFLVTKSYLNVTWGVEGLNFERPYCISPVSIDNAEFVVCPRNNSCLGWSFET